MCDQEMPLEGLGTGLFETMSALHECGFTRTHINKEPGRGGHSSAGEVESEWSSMGFTGHLALLNS